MKVELLDTKNVFFMKNTKKWIKFLKIIFLAVGILWTIPFFFNGFLLLFLQPC